MEPGHISVHPLRRHPQEPRSSHLKGQECQLRLMDCRASGEYALKVHAYRLLQP